jgi:hypothetical protein
MMLCVYSHEKLASMVLYVKAEVAYAAVAQCALLAYRY